MYVLKIRIYLFYLLRLEFLCRCCRFGLYLVVGDCGILLVVVDWLVSDLCFGFYCRSLDCRVF